VFETEKKNTFDYINNPMRFFDQHLNILKVLQLFLLQICIN